tara:strand:- start:116 stop:439 length:324 start_codon:yes stop_codon:yes gene_type:complete
LPSFDLGSAALLGKRRIQCIEFEGHSCLLIFLDGRFYATEQECPHKQASLCFAQLSGRHLVCPWHEARFDIESGRCSGPLMLHDLKTWPVSEENGRVIIYFPGEGDE